MPKLPAPPTEPSHRDLLINAIHRAAAERGGSCLTGHVTLEYRKLCHARGLAPVSPTRVSQLLRSMQERGEVLREAAGVPGQGGGRTSRITPRSSSAPLPRPRPREDAAPVVDEPEPAVDFESCGECREKVAAAKDLTQRDLADLVLVHERVHVTVVDGVRIPRPRPARRPPLPHGCIGSVQGFFDAFLQDRAHEARRRRHSGRAAGAHGLSEDALRVDRAEGGAP